MPAEFRLTSFPNLTGHDYDRDRDQDLQVCQKVFYRKTFTKRHVLIAWSILLRGYVPGDAVVFEVDDEVVLVDFETDSFKSYTKNIVSTDGVQDWLVLQAGGSAVYFDAEPPIENLPQIYVAVERNSSLETLSVNASLNLLSEIQLHHLCFQLSYILEWVQKSPGSRLPQFPFDPILEISNSTPSLAHKLSIINPNPQLLSGPRLLHHLPQKSPLAVLRQPDDIAIDFLLSDGITRSTLNYGQLDILSTNFARRILRFLQSEEAAEPVIVPVLVPQSTNLYIALLGILKAGAAFAPIYLDIPEERLKFILTDISAKVVVVHKALQHKLPCHSALHIIVIDDEHTIDIGAPTNPDLPLPASIDPFSPAYVMYTSGSTGTPKGVSISHLAVTQSLLAHDKHIPAYRRFLQFASPTFDVFVFEVFFTLYRGATLAGSDRSLLLNDIVKTINLLEVDAIELTPSVLGDLVIKKENIPTVKLVLTIGEMLTRHIVEEFGDGLLQGMYGPTEVAIHCTIAANFRASGKVGDVGRPLDTVSAFIVSPTVQDGQVQILPVGWVGELALGGHQLANGYLNRPELTMEVFIQTNYGKLYRTGDRARILADGRIECLGRLATGQIKLRGQRIELGEIEEALRKVPGICGAVATVVEGNLIGFVGGLDRIKPATIKEQLKKWLLGHMVPSEIYVYDDLPKLPSGKVDRKKLEGYARSKLYLSGKVDKTEDMSTSEWKIADALKELLCLEHISKSKSLISQGLDSLRTIQLCSELRKSGFTIEVLDILRADSIEKLAMGLGNPNLCVESQNFADDSVDILFNEVFRIGTTMLERKGFKDIHQIEAVIPCTHVQQAMLVETLKDNKCYTNRILLEVPSRFADDYIEHAFKEVIQRNEILRTGFLLLEQSIGETFAQIIWKSPQQTQFCILKEFQGEFQFSIETMLLPPLQIQLLREETRTLLSIYIHHALYDDWSWEHILKDFESVLLQRETVKIPPRPQFREVVKYNYAKQNKLGDCKHFWKEYLNGASNSFLPTFHSRSDVFPEVGKIPLKLQTSRAAIELCARNYTTSPQAIVQLAWACLLGFYLNSSDVVFGVVSSGRTIPIVGVEDVIGPCIVTLPLRVNFRSQQTKCVALMREIHALNRELIAYSDLPLRDIRASAGIGTVNFDTLLIWQQTLSGFSHTSSIVNQISSEDHLEFNLVLEAEPRSEDIVLIATYKLNKLPHSQVEILLSQLSQMISKIVLNPMCTINSIIEGLEEALLSIGNPNPLMPKGMPSLLELIERAVSTHPTSIALEFVDDLQNGTVQSKKFTYSELNASANQLAHKLVELGVVAGDVICLYMEKSAMFYVSILATLKAGAGCLPLTPHISQETVCLALRSSQCRVCLCTTQTICRFNGSNSIEIAINVDAVDLGMLPTTNPGVISKLSDLAYMVFSCRDVDIPNGVLVTQENIVANIIALSKLCLLVPGSKLLPFCSQDFDISVLESFFAWATSLCLCASKKDVLMQDIEGIINALQISHLWLTPTMAAPLRPCNVPSVKLLITAGELISPIVVNNWADRGLHQGYGFSELTSICTLKLNVGKKDSIHNIGHTLENTSVFVLREGDDFVVLPKGAVGELCFGGSQVARGYLNLTEATASKFITHPKYGKIYRTGHFGRLLTDCSIEYLGRQRDQVVIGGSIIEVEEIDNILLESPVVLNAVTLPVERGHGARQLVSFVVLHRYSELHQASIVARPEKGLVEIIQELFRIITSRLPSHMVVSLIIPVIAVPTTSQGKVNKTVLLQLLKETDHATLECFMVGNRYSDGEWSETERKLMEIIAHHSHVPVSELGQNTSIFSLGIDSISAIRLSYLIQEAGFKRLEVFQILQCHTIFSLSRLIDSNTSAGNSETTALHESLDEFADSVIFSVLEKLNLNESEVAKVLPCTPLQEAMLAERHGVDATFFYTHTIFKIKGDLNKLRTAWETVLHRNEIMRTCFALTSHPTHPYAQLILKNYNLPWFEVEVEDKEDIMDTVDRQIGLLPSKLKLSRPPYAFTLFKTRETRILVMSIHHSLYDGFAIDLLLEEAALVYHGRPLPTRTTFDKYLQYMQAQSFEKSNGYWREALRDLQPFEFPDLTGLSTAYKAGSRHVSTLRSSCSKKMTAIENSCRQMSISLLAFGQAAWVRLLAAYTGETDICFGNVVSGRTIPVDGVETITAPCFNTIPLRIIVTPELTNVGMMEILQRKNSEALPFQLTPLRKIMNLLTTDGRVLFDSLFILHHPKIPLSQKLWEVIDDRGQMDFAVVLELLPNREKDTLDITLHVRRTVIPEEYASIILRHVDLTLCALLDDPACISSDYSFLDTSLLSIANTPASTIPEAGDMLLHTLFERHAEVKPSEITLEFLSDFGELEKWTFQQFNCLANQIAHLLLSKGVLHHETLPIAIEKSPIFYACVLAALKLGLPFTPIEPSIPINRRSFMLEELNAKYVVVDDLHSFERLPPNIIPISISSFNLQKQPHTNPVVEQKLEQVAYRLYTSGSTGHPKAVSVDVKNVLQTIRASKSILPWNPKSKLLQFAAITFDMCYYDCFISWNYGFTLCSAGKRKLLDELEDTIREMNVTILDLTPTIASTLNPKNLPKVELLYCIGEAMQYCLAEMWEGRCVNSYGPTEAAMCCSIVAVNRKVKPSNIGKPFPTAGFSVRSRDSSFLLPILAVGELWISGPQVAREYHNDKSLTERRFIDVPESGKTYRTGDLVRMLGNGTFEFVGRKDDQVKVRGLRVELDEINMILKRADKRIRSVSTVIIKRSENAREQLVSFLSLEDKNYPGISAKFLHKTDVTNEILHSARRTAEQTLPIYMVPGVMLFVNFIPLSAAGKVDKKQLEQLFCDRGIDTLCCDLDSDEWTEEEKQLRDILSEFSVIPIENISRSSTIYELGLDSITASQVATSLKKKGFNISAFDILECPSIKQLSPRLANKRYSKREKKPIQPISDGLLNFNQNFCEIICRENDIFRDRVDAVYPCTAMQSGMLSQSLLSDENVYCNHILLKLSPFVELSSLQASWEQVFHAHDMLRAGFAQIEDENHSFAMVIFKPHKLPLPWSFIDCGDADIEKLATEHRRFRSIEMTKKLQQPLWYVTVLKGLDLHLLFSAHHAIFDAYSLQLIYDDVALHYMEGTQRTRPHFFSVLNRILEGGAESSLPKLEKSYWIDQFQAAGATKFPNLTITRVKSPSTHVTTLHSSWKLSQIEKESQSLGCSVNALTQAVWAKLLSAYVGESHITYGQVLSGRTGILDAEEVIFPCITTLPTLVKITGTNRDLILQIQERNAQLLQHQYTPLQLVQKWVDHRDQKLFDTIFVYQNTGSIGGQDMPLWKIENEYACVDYAISVEIVPTAFDRLLFRFTSKNSILPVEQSSVLARQFDSMVIDTLLHPYRSSSDLSQLSVSLLSHIPPRDREISCDVHLVHQFVERYADRTPNNVALEFATKITNDGVLRQQWTYREFEEQSNKVANFLLGFGVKTGDLIGICFDKSPCASWTIVGILKAGCGYVALDPAAPIDRKLFILRDSNAKCVLTVEPLVEHFKGMVMVDVFSVVTFRGFKQASTQRPSTNRVTPQSLCYCLYTSGTTGTPKGCEITHENVIQAMLAFQRLFKGSWDSESRFFQFASFHFDVSVLEMFWSWSVGICVTSAPRDVIFENLPLAIKLLGITHLDLTPSLAALLCPKDVPQLCRGIFIVGGEALKQDILDAWGKTGALCNGYGPTEVTIGCTMLTRVRADDRPSNIGYQFDNVGSFVMSPGTNQLVPRGAIGELCVFGKLVGKGYLNRKALTDEKFPYLEQYSERVYKTGDLVRMLHDGSFDFIGRLDDQVKLRGQRLEIGEINETLRMADPQVRAVATLVMKHPKQRKDHLVSFIALGAFRVNKKEIPTLLEASKSVLKIIKKAIDTCKKNLPLYMVPIYILPISDIPLSANNKADNKQLGQLYANTSLETIHRLANTATNQERELSETEVHIISILTDMTKLAPEDVKLTSTFFELGLDSISIVSLTRKLKKRGFNSATVSLVMGNSTTERLASALTLVSDGSAELNRLEYTNQFVAAYANKVSYHVCSQLGIDYDRVDRILPCTALQEGMILQFLNCDGALYLNSFVFDLTDCVNCDALQKAWINVISHTDILRTCFSETLSGYAQVVLKPTVNNSAVTSFKEVGSVKQILAADRKRLTKYKRKFLEQPPIHLTFFSTGKSRFLALHIFHALYDGNSLPLILKDVSDAYRGKCKTRQLQFPEMLSHILSVDLQGAERFWRENLSNMTYTSFPRDFTNGSTISRVVKHLAEINLESILSVCESLGCTCQAIFQTVWAAVLASYIGENVTFGIVVSGRSIPIEGIEDAVGPLFNTIPCSIQLGKSSWKALVKQFHDFNARSAPYHHTPLRLIRKWMGLAPRAQLFDTLFIYHKVHEDYEIEAPWKMVETESVLDFPISIEVEQTSNGQIFLTIAVKSLVMSDSELENLIGKLEAALDTILKSPEAFIPTSPRIQSLAGGLADMDINVNKTNFQWDDNAKTIRLAIAMLAQIDCNQIHEDTSIFEVGLDSIEAIKLCARLRQDNIQLPVSAVMRNPTIRKMSAFVEKASLTAKIRNEKSILLDFEDQARRCLTRGGIEAIYPATPLQEGIIAETIASDYRLYFNHEVNKIRENVDIHILRKAWGEVVRRNPILRTIFFSTHDLGMQTPFTFGQLVESDIKLSWEEISIPSDEELERMLTEIMTRERNKANIFKFPPIKVTIIHAGRACYMILSISHALYDGWSFGLLHEDIRCAYHGALHTRPSYRPLLENIISIESEQVSKFWKQRLSGIELSEFPNLEGVQGAQIVETNRAEVISNLAISELTNFCKSQGVTLQSLGQTCWGLTIARYLKKSDVLFGTVLSGRDINHGDEMMFPALNTIPARVIVHGTYQDMLSFMQESMGYALKFQHTPLRMIQKMVGTMGKKLFDSLFIYQRPLSVFEDTLFSLVKGSSDVEYNVAVEMSPEENRLVWRIACKSTVMNADQTRELLGFLDVLLTDIVNSPNSLAVNYFEDLAQFGKIPVAKSSRKRHFIPESETPSTPNSDESNKDYLASSSGLDWTPLEAEILKVIAEVSGLSENSIERGQTIFHLGLDSISAIIVSSELRKKAIDLSVVEILKRPTIENMAALHLQKQVSMKQNENIVGDSVGWDMSLQNELRNVDVAELLKSKSIDQNAVEAVMPTTPGQRYMLSVWKNTKGSLFMPTFAFKIPGHVDEDRLRYAWRKLLNLESILRTTFLSTTSMEAPVIQIVFKHPIPQFIWRDRTGMDLKDVVAKGVAEEQMNLALCHPPARITVLNTNNHSVILLTIHHALYDGVSLPLLVQKLQELYNSPVCTPSNTITSEYFKAVVGYTYTQDKSKQKQFWRNYLKGTTSSLLAESNDFIRANAKCRTTLFDPHFNQDGRELESLCREWGITLQALLIAAFAKVYVHELNSKRRQTQEDLVIGLYQSQRHFHIFGIENLAKLPAPTLNLIPLRIRKPASATLMNVTQSIQEDLVKISSPEVSAGVGIDDIHRWTSEDGEEGIMIDTYFNYLRFLPGPDGSKKQEKEEDIVNKTIHSFEEPVEFEEIAAANLPHMSTEVGIEGRVAGHYAVLPDLDADISMIEGLDTGKIMTNLDIETSYKHGNIGLGIFGRGDLIDIKGVERVLQGMKEILRNGI